MPSTISGYEAQRDHFRECSTQQLRRWLNTGMYRPGSPLWQAANDVLIERIDLDSPQMAGPRYVVQRDGNGTHGVYDFVWDEMITSGWSYFEAAALRDSFNTSQLYGQTGEPGHVWL